MKRYELFEFRAEVGHEICDDLLLYKQIHELLPIDHLLPSRKGLLDQLRYVILIDGATSVRRKLLILENREIAKSTEETIEEEVQLALVKLVLILESKEEHDVLSDDLLGAVEREDHNSEEFERADASKLLVVEPFKQVLARLSLV